MNLRLGDWLYCKTFKYSNGKVIDYRHDKFIIDCSICILELGLAEIECHFTRGS